MTTGILLTGASGYVGSALRRLYTARGTPVIGLGRRDAEVVCDLSAGGVDWSTVPSFDVLVHCAGPMTGDAAAVVAMLRIATNLLGGLPEAVTRLVLVSSAYVYAPAAIPVTEEEPPRPTEAYGFGKLAVESLFHGVVKASGRALSVLRPCAIVGPGDPNRKAVTRFVADARRGVAPTLFGDVTFARDYIHVDDVARAIATAADARISTGEPSRTYNVCTGRSWSPRGLACLIAELRPSLGAAPPAGPDEAVGYRFDPGRARRELGWAPRFDMRTVIASLLAEGDVP